VKLADLGFSKDLSSITRGYAMAEDLHALGFVVLSLLLTCLAQWPLTLEYTLPDEDTLQRRMTDIFEKDVKLFYACVQDKVFGGQIWSNCWMKKRVGKFWNCCYLLVNAWQMSSRGSYQLQRGGCFRNPFSDDKTKVNS
jgi:hypothetical protein